MIYTNLHLHGEHIVVMRWSKGKRGSVRPSCGLPLAKLLYLRLSFDWRLGYFKVGVEQANQFITSQVPKVQSHHQSIHKRHKGQIITEDMKIRCLNKLMDRFGSLLFTHLIAHPTLPLGTGSSKSPSSSARHDWA